MGASDSKSLNIPRAGHCLFFTHEEQISAGRIGVARTTGPGADERALERQPDFRNGAKVVLEPPRWAGVLGDHKGSLGVVKSSRETPEGRMYTVVLNPVLDGIPGAREDGDEAQTVEIKGEWIKRAGTTAQSSDVQHLLLEEVLSSGDTYRIPVFQRRYCWTEDHWRRLWKCVVAVRDDEGLNNHSLERLMLLRNPTRFSLVVLDGQQRLTTVIILVAALRDRLQELGEQDAAAALGHLCSDDRLLPTLDDRIDFHRCLTEALPGGRAPLVCAKRVFASLCQPLDGEACRATARALLGRVSMTAFVLENEDSVQAVFESMARRQQALGELAEAGHDLNSCAECYVEGEGGKQVASTHWGPNGERLCSRHAAMHGGGSEAMTPGVPMSPVDLIRNFVIDHYGTEDAMRLAHADYWSPIETLCSDRFCSVEAGLAAFFAEQGFPSRTRWELYTSFLGWWRSGEVPSPESKGGVEEHARIKLRELLAGIAGACDKRLTLTHAIVQPVSAIAR